MQFNFVSDGLYEYNFTKSLSKSSVEGTPESYIIPIFCKSSEYAFLSIFV